MRLRWATHLHTTWPPLIMALGLLLLLTYLLFLSRTPAPTHDTDFHAALQDIALADVQLTRDVLLARTGLLPHVDSLAQTTGALRQALSRLQPGQNASSDDIAIHLQHHVKPLSTALGEKFRLVEYFTADNALVQNSLLYVLRAGHGLSLHTAALGQTTVVADLAMLSHALLRLLHSPQSTAAAELLELLNRLPPMPALQQDLDLLATHGRRVVDLLPQLDTLVRQLLSLPTTRHLRALHDAVLQYGARRAANAQVFRLLLYLVALALLGTLLFLHRRLQVQAQALRTSEEHFRAITETASEAIISAAHTWTIVSWNAAATSMFGYQASEAMGMSLLQLLPAHCQTTLTAWLAQQEAPGQSRTPVELPGMRQDGSTFPLDISLSAWSTAQGSYVTAMIRDLTTRKRLEEQTRQQELQLIQANKMTALGTLVSGVAHEVNNPNQMVLMNTQMLADTWHDVIPILDAYTQQAGEIQLGGLPYAEMREALPLLIQDLHAGAEHIAHIINDLRDFARPFARRRPQPVCLNDAVQRGARLLRHVIQRKTTQFQSELASSLPPVLGDVQDLTHVVVNLLVNALEALPDTTGSVRVVTRLAADQRSLVLEVTDQGAGIAPEHLARLCDPFFTTKAATGGTGLGLAITATLVHAHGGQLTFQSKLGHGTCVAVTLPVAEPPLAQASTSLALEHGLEVPGTRPQSG
ncbi:MAG: PAS domain S-box protein [Candidatus Tectomicrobia bacterium]|uniref:histidine kinase n=1 Tax=Tectimicrobiota bacterium TaxID=2528274 RepID=A0A937W3G6_UNCTE|nr:PAS domain S-box protein [Candidatus Tectomicrobia bacterium]